MQSEEEDKNLVPLNDSSLKSPSELPYSHQGTINTHYSSYSKVPHSILERKIWIRNLWWRLASGLFLCAV